MLLSPLLLVVSMTLSSPLSTLSSPSLNLLSPWSSPVAVTLSSHLSLSISMSLSLCPSLSSPTYVLSTAIVLLFASVTDVSSNTVGREQSFAGSFFWCRQAEKCVGVAHCTSVVSGAVTVEVVQFSWWTEKCFGVGGTLLPMEDLLHFS